MTTPDPFAFGAGAFGVNPFGPAVTPPPPPPVPPGSTGRPQLYPSATGAPKLTHLTWLLDWSTGDSCLDAAGNIAVASAPYSIAQDIATQLSTFLGECWYDTTQGVPYWQQILGKRPPASLLVSLLEAQALKVPDVASVTVTIGGINAKRGVIGQLTATDTQGNAITLALGGAVLGILATQQGSPITIGGQTIEV
jgi:hypothetical protein